LNLAPEPSIGRRETRDGLVAVVAVVALVSAGCYASYQIYADGAPGTDAHDAADEGWADDAGPDADADTDDGGEVVVAECPATLPTEGPVRLTLRWRRSTAGIWTAPGSAGFGVVGGVVLAAVPGGLGSGHGPALLRSTADSGAPLVDGPEDVAALPGSTAVGAVSLPPAEVLFVGTALLPPHDRGDFLYAVPVDSSGHGISTCELESISWPWTVTDVRAAAMPSPDSRLLVARTAEGTFPDGGWGVDRGDSWCSAGDWAGSGPLRRDPTDSGEAFAAIGRERIAWTYPEGMDSLNVEEGLGFVTVLWRARTPSAPLAVVINADGTSDFVVAGRCDDPIVGVQLWTERRSGFDLSPVANADLAMLEPLVDRPEPQALEGDGRSLVLAWVARRDVAGSPVPACLYATPLDDLGRSAGPSVRVDDAGRAIGAGIDHVRMVVDGAAVYVLWKHDSDVWVARFDAAT
jgi:hypothetical protein